MRGCDFTANVIDGGAALTECGLIQFPPNKSVINICNLFYLFIFLKCDSILYDSRPVSVLMCDKCSYMYFPFASVLLLVCIADCFTLNACQSERRNKYPYARISCQ